LCKEAPIREGDQTDMPSAKPKWLPVIETARCTGCGWCVAACPEHVLVLERSGWRKTSVLLDEAGCTGCRKCEVKCPFGVIAMVRIRQAEGVACLDGPGSTGNP